MLDQAHAKRAAAAAPSNPSRSTQHAVLCALMAAASSYLSPPMKAPARAATRARGTRNTQPWVCEPATPVWRAAYVGSGHFGSIGVTGLQRASVLVSASKTVVSRRKQES